LNTWRGDPAAAQIGSTMRGACSSSSKRPVDLSPFTNSPTVPDKTHEPRPLGRNQMIVVTAAELLESMREN
jgi:hypothetical protein